MRFSPAAAGLCLQCSGRGCMLAVHGTPHECASHREFGFLDLLLLFTSARAPPTCLKFMARRTSALLTCCSGCLLAVQSLGCFGCLLAVQTAVRECCGRALKRAAARFCLQRTDLISSQLLLWRVDACESIVGHDPQASGLPTLQPHLQAACRPPHCSRTCNNITWAQQAQVGVPSRLQFHRNSSQFCYK